MSSPNLFAAVPEASTQAISGSGLELPRIQPEIGVLVNSNPTLELDEPIRNCNLGSRYGFKLVVCQNGCFFVLLQLSTLAGCFILWISLFCSGSGGCTCVLLFFAISQNSGVGFLGFYNSGSGFLWFCLYCRDVSVLGFYSMSARIPLDSLGFYSMSARIPLDSLALFFAVSQLRLHMHFLGKICCKNHGIHFQCFQNVRKRASLVSLVFTAC